VTFKPTHTGLSKAWLVIGDSTSLGWHTAAVAGTGTSLPNALDVYVSPTFTGHTIRWPALSTAGGTAVRGYFLHRYVDGVESTQWVYAQGGDGGYVRVADASPKAGVEYAVSVVNEIGEGPTGTRTSAARATEQIAVTGGDPAKRELMAGERLGHPQAGCHELAGRPFARLRNRLDRDRAVDSPGGPERTRDGREAVGVPVRHHPSVLVTGRFADRLPSA
jgi:hypothetical protein